MSQGKSKQRGMIMSWCNRRYYGRLKTLSKGITRIRENESMSAGIGFGLNGV